MWSEILDVAISNGIFAVLFLIMLIYELKDSSNREKKYQNTIDKLASNYTELKSLKEKVVDISSDVEEIKSDIRQVVAKAQIKPKTTKTSSSAKTRTSKKIIEEQKQET